jgi:hypothetical protein
MAQRLDQTPPWVHRYPWDEWTDGSTWQIRRGEDYDVATENMRVNLHMRARHLPGKVKTTKFVDAASEGLIFQFLPALSRPTTTAQTSGDTAALEALYQDCCYIYETARREVTIPRSDRTRQKYAAIRFKQQVDAGHAADRLIDAVTRIVERRTQGFGHLEAAERPDLMLETFVLDETKPYHKLLPARIIEIARARMTDYWRRHPGGGKE